jgi:hypothetical protein
MMTMEVIPEPSSPGSVVLDIGGEVGAATIFVPATLLGREIEIRDVQDEWAGTHVGVRERVLPDGPAWAAVFPSLSQGDYEIRMRGGVDEMPTFTFAVEGGRVSTVSWLTD